MSEGTAGGAAGGVCTTDLELVVQSWDAWLAEATGVAESAARGQSLAELYPELATRGLLARIRRVGETGTVEVLAPAFHEYLIPCAPRVRSPHFSRMQQHVTIAPLRADDAVIGIMISIEDVTARRVRERELALQLQSADDAVRLGAVRAIGAEDGSAEVLAGALGDRSWRVRRAAADELAGAHDDSVIDALVAAVRDRHRDAAVLNAALTALVHAERDVLPALVPLLDAADTDLRTYVALALGLLEDPRAVRPLVRALGDADANVRFHAVEALGRIRSREAVLPVAAIAESRDFSVAFAALDTLAAIGEPSVAPRIVPLLDDPMLQVAAVDALGRLGSEDAVAPLATLMGTAGAPVAAIAGALAMLAERHAQSHDGDGAVIADLARAVIDAPAIRALIDAIDRASEEELYRLVVVLAWLDADGVDAALAQLVANPAVRKTAAASLAERGPRAVSALLGVLDTEDDEARKAAAAALGRTGAASAVPALIALLDGAPDVAVVAASALGAIGDARAFEPLLAQLDHPHATVRQASVAALNSIGHPEMPARVRALFADPSPRVREAAVKLAGYRGEESALASVLALCDDPDDAVRRAAVEQLPHFDDVRASETIARALEHGSAAVRAASARALAHVPAGDALPMLERACRDRDPWVRYYAARSMGRHGRPGASASLLALATGDPVPPVRIAAIEALAEIGDESAVSSLLPVVGDPDPAVAAPAMLALADTGNETVLPALLRELASEDHGRRLAALDAIGRLRDPGAVPDVASIARGHTDPDLRERATLALARIGDASAVAALVSLAEDPRRGADVVAALGGLGEARVNDVARGLAHPDVGVRCVIVEALGRMRARRAAGALSRALADADETVRLAAAHALARLDLRAATSHATSD